MTWLISFSIGCLIGIILFLLGWFMPIIGLTDVAPQMLQAAYRIPELADRFVPEVLMAMQMAFATGATLVLVSFVTFAVTTRFSARPTGPGEVGRSWRVVLWWLLLIITAVLNYAAVEYFLSWQLIIVDSVAASQFSLITAIAAAIAYWFICFFGVERMMRPAVPLADRR